MGCLMKYFINKSGEVYAYSDSDLDTVSRISELESDEDLESLNEILPVFFEIRENLKGMRELTNDELDAHLNPPPTESGERRNRDTLLLELDAVVSNPLRWSELDEDEKDQASAYRKALLDVPQQDGFPLEIIWPEKPDWLFASSHKTLNSES